MTGKGDAKHLPASSIPIGKAAIRECRFSRIVRANTGYVEKNNNDGHSLPLKGKGLAWILPPSYGRRCPEGVEVG